MHIDGTNNKKGDTKILPKKQVIRRLDPSVVGAIAHAVLSYSTALCCGIRLEKKEPTSVIKSQRFSVTRRMQTDYLSAAKYVAEHD